MIFRSTRKSGAAKIRRKLSNVKIRGKRIFSRARCVVRVAQAKLAKNRKLLAACTAKARAAAVKRIAASNKKQPYAKATAMSKQNLRKPTLKVNSPTVHLKTGVAATNSSKLQLRTASPVIRHGETKPPTLTKFTPHSKQEASSALRIHEPTLSTTMAKKIAVFNKEGNIQVERAYNAIMSGLKASWTQLQNDTSQIPLAQRKTDVEIMEKLYTKYYGPVVRFNSKAVPGFKQYTASQKK